ncbi:MAG: hypothetical protein EOO16_18990 [Chitinophagaceae bacterium]|nr:MAG: hypothetical protein EOO16_18990 [Chitinophagaceae bacterium]
MARNNIPFIHNYCDRWCERCPLTSRCAVFEMNEDLPPEAADPENEAFWQTLSDRFTESLHLLEEGAARHGIVLEEPTPEELVLHRQQEEETGRRLEDTPLLTAARTYADAVEILFTESDLWERKGAALTRETTLGIKTVEKGLRETELLADCRHVLGWYQHFIGVKFQRALHGLWEDGDEARAPQSDANGSAKIALLAVERSRLALTTLLSLVGEEDAVLDLLATLERIEKEGRNHFPNAGRFCRPGFDEPA